MESFFIFLIYISGFLYPIFSLFIGSLRNPILEKCREIAYRRENTNFSTEQEYNNDWNCEAKLFNKSLKFTYLSSGIWIFGVICCLWSISHSAELINSWEGINWEMGNRSGGGRGAVLFLLISSWRQLIFLFSIAHLVIMNVVLPIFIMKRFQKEGLDLKDFFSTYKKKKLLDL